jgi:hypothetical protein
MGRSPATSTATIGIGGVECHMKFRRTLLMATSDVGSLAAVVVPIDERSVGPASRHQPSCAFAVQGRLSRAGDR